MLHFTNLTKVYGNGTDGTRALNGISGAIGIGETVALCGPSGSGKSSLLNICGLLDPDYQGELYLDDEKMTGNSKNLTKVRREKLGFMFQNFNLIAVMTAFENIEYPLLMLGLSKVERYRRVARLIDAIGLSAQARKRPDQLSGGQQQRIAMARALVKAPALIIADEPTANLDTATAHRVIDLMRDLGRELGSTFLIATHDQRMSDRCDRVMHLVDGALSEACANKEYLNKKQQPNICRPGG